MRRHITNLVRVSQQVLILPATSSPGRPLARSSVVVSQRGEDVVVSKA
jgi:hypothetical protein